MESSRIEGAKAWLAKGQDRASVEELVGKFEKRVERSDPVDPDYDENRVVLGLLQGALSTGEVTESSAEPTSAGDLARQGPGRQMNAQCRQTAWPSGSSQGDTGGGQTYSLAEGAVLHGEPDASVQRIADPDIKKARVAELRQMMINPLR
ncbi:hypothetical protein [Ferrimonas marina]|uniref:Uncharacterized protein n=1 Tax=Ferrimonas marina TaxID=299255 RepID=A0A1M5UEG0_9GAMM|nr:hypothetical protein [Ferrimonas marina]SHH61432.1 hypothetical protein SAMN02745129_2532 [Ferrimonas marina]